MPSNCNKIPHWDDIMKKEWQDSTSTNKASWRRNKSASPTMHASQCMDIWTTTIQSNSTISWTQHTSSTIIWFVCPNSDKYGDVIEFRQVRSIDNLTLTSLRLIHQWYGISHIFKFITWCSELSRSNWQTEASEEDSLTPDRLTRWNHEQTKWKRGIPIW